MNRQSFIDLTALLDVVLILFFAALINLAGRAEASQQMALRLEQNMADLSAANQQLTSQNAELLADNSAIKQQLSDLYGTEMDDIDDYRAILNRVSVLEIALRGDDNQIIINDKASTVNIVRENFLTDERQKQLDKKVMRLLNDAVDNRSKSDIIYLKVVVSDRDVYKFAVDYLMAKIDIAIERYGRDKVILSKWQ